MTGGVDMLGEVAQTRAQSSSRAEKPNTMDLIAGKLHKILTTLEYI